MHHGLLVATLVALSTGCIPSSSDNPPVVTTTLPPSNTTTSSPVNTTTASNITTTTVATVNTTSTALITTTTIPTTTTTPVPQCCSYPFNPTSVNTAEPQSTMWSCNQTVTITCALTGNMTYIEAGLYASNGTNPGMANVGIETRGINTTLPVICNGTAQRWHYEGRTELFTTVYCAYNTGSSWLVLG